jgi:hypothetical protein
LAPVRGILGDGRDTFSDTPAQQIVSLAFLPSSTKEGTRAADNGGVFASGWRSWGRGRSATESIGHNGSDWRTVALQNLVRLVA